MKHTLIKTADGSHSLYMNELDEHYHSIHGAIRESQHVFIKTGLQHLAEQGYSSISILEIGLGTGLNTLLTAMEAEELDVKISYTALEAFPLSMNVLNQLNYVELLSCKSENTIEKKFELIHSCEWENASQLTDNFSLHKIKNTLQEIKFKNTFDLVYFDAFGPRVQPEMWAEELFSKIFAATNSKGCLVTYCAKGEVKRTIKKVGFTLETLPGPPGKREMVRGTKN